MKIIIAPDKFKGSLAAIDVCAAIAGGIREADASTETISLPMADGGDGFAAVIQHYLQTDTMDCHSVDPLNRPIQASYQWNKQMNTAIIEMAIASGLVLLTDNERNPLLTSTTGTGLMIKDAIARGAKKIILGIGGSATNDGGIGVLHALGFQFLDDQKNELTPVGGNLTAIAEIIVPELPVIAFEIACDVTNKLTGPNGAAAVYGPQKGANPQMVDFLDRGLINLATVIRRQTGIDVTDIKGSGAAGGIAASLIPFFDVKLKQGIDMIIEVSGIETKMADAQLFITGEGKIDAQSLQGKVIGKIAALGSGIHIPVIAFCGKLDLTPEELRQTGLTAAYTISEDIPIAESMQHAAGLLTEKTKKVISSFLSTTLR